MSHGIKYKIMLNTSCITSDMTFYRFVLNEQNAKSVRTKHTHAAKDYER